MTKTSALDAWRSQVEAHHAQSERAQGQIERESDFWRPYASSFRADPRRTDDPLLDRLLASVNPEHTVLDVGGGAGRLALPLALQCRQVTIVEPSESMLEQLDEVVREAGIGNVSHVHSNWEDAEVEPADLVLCAHVVYGVANIEPFVRKLESHARERVLLVVFIDSPQSGFSPIWEDVHGEERIDLPALPELMPALWEIEIYPDLEMVPAGGTQTFESRDAAVEMARRRLYVAPDTEQDHRLHAALEDRLVERDGKLVFRHARPRHQALISWAAA